MKTNSANQIIIDENDFVELLYQQAPDSHIVVEKSEFIEKYIGMCELYEIDTATKFSMETTLSDEEFVAASVNDWSLPEKYSNMDIYDILISRCPTQDQIDRVDAEWAEYTKRNMTATLQFLVYFVDTMRSRNLVWGVGRGSSVASYVLFLLKVHRVDSLKYGLDIKEFLK